MLRGLLVILLAAALGACSDRNPEAAPSGATAPPSGKAAVPLWNGARSGMSVDQVRALFPAVESSPEPETLYGGVRGELSWPETDVLGQRARVIFFFLPDGGGLRQVMARPLAARRQASPENLALARVLAEALTQTYGQPSECGETPLGFDCLWRSGDVDVALTLIQSTGRTTIFNVSFRPSESMEAS